MMQIVNSSRYDEIIEKIKDCLRGYEAIVKDNKVYLLLANGDTINLSFPKNHIPHLLGVYIDKLRTANIVKTSISSYDVLTKMVNGDLSYYGVQHTNNNFDFSTLFSDYIDAKIEIFNDALKVRTDDIYCIIKYDSERTYTTGEEKENSDYFIIRRIGKKFSALGIAKSDERNSYVPVTSRLYNNYDELKEFLSKVAKNQEITYPVSFNIENYYTGFNTKGFAKLEDKLEVNRTLKDIAYKFKAIPSTGRDTIATIERFLNNRQKNNNNSSILNLIRDNITSGSLIDIEEVKEMLDDGEIPEELQSLIDSCNDLVCSKSTNDKSISNSYSSIQKENLDLKTKCEELKNELLELKAKVSGLEEENTSLKESNDTNSKKLKILTDAYESIK